MASRFTSTGDFHDGFSLSLLLELPAGARPGGRPEWVRDRRVTALVFGEQTWDLSWTHPCGSPQSNSSHLLRIVMCHVFFQWQTSSWAVLICGMSPNTLDRQPFHFSRCQVVGPTCWILTIQCSLWKPVFAREKLWSFSTTWTSVFLTDLEKIRNAPFRFYLFIIFTSSAPQAPPNAIFRS